MTKHPLPIAIPKGYFPILTQPYGDKSTIDWYKANGLNITEHNGADFTISFVGATEDQARMATYGAKLVCPVELSYLSKAWWDNPMSTKGNGIQITWTEDGKDISIRFWHCSEITQQSTYKKEEQVGLIGNNGLVRPEPTPYCVYCGSHLHLMVYVNGVLTDPKEIFDFTKWFIANDTGVGKDLPPIIYFVQKLWNKIFSIAK